MKLINTDGMAFIGPGSEWLWTAVSGIVLAVTFLAIYRQLRLQASAGALDQIAGFTREWDSEGMARSRLAVLLALRDGADPRNLRAATFEIGNYWERVGYLVRAGHIDRNVVFETLPNAKSWWIWLAPAVRAIRLDEGWPRLYEHFEWLVGLWDEATLKKGETPPDEALAARLLPADIEYNRGQIRTAEELRAVIVRPMSPTTLTPDVSAG